MQQLELMHRKAEVDIEKLKQEQVLKERELELEKVRAERESDQASSLSSATQFHCSAVKTETTSIFGGDRLH